MNKLLYEGVLNNGQYHGIGKLYDENGGIYYNGEFKEISWTA